MSKKFRRLYETAFDSKISKSDDDLLSADKQEADIAQRLTNQLQLSASTNSVQRCDGNGNGGAVRGTTPSKIPCKNRLFGFLLQSKKRAGRFSSNNNNKYRSTDSMVTSSSLSLESITTSDSMSSHSSESPRYYNRFPEPHVLSPISDKSSQDAGAEISDFERRKCSTFTVTTADPSADRTMAAVVKTKPPQSLGLIKLNRDHRQQHHGSDSGISVGSKPGDNYQELLDVPFDMPKLRRKQKSEVFHAGQPSTMIATTEQPSELTSKVDGSMRIQTNDAPTPSIPLDIPKLRKRQMDSCSRVMSLDFDIGAYGSCSPRNSGSNIVNLEELPFDMPKLKRINLHNNKDENKPDRSSLFLNIKSSNNYCAAANENNRPLMKNFQNKNQPNRPTLSLTNIKPLNFVEDIDASLPLDQQCWYHGSMNRLEAEKVLHGQEEGSYLVRGNRGSYALSIKSAKGYIHMRITQSGEKNYLGQSDRPFDTIPDLIRHYTLNKLPAKGAEHVGLIRPLAHQIL